MKSLTGPMTPERLFNNDTGIVTGFLMCFFFTCEEGLLQARRAIRNARVQKLTGLIPFGSEPHKPHKGFGEIQGRFVIVGNKIPGYKEGDIVMSFLGSIKKLRTIQR